MTSTMKGLRVNTTDMRRSFAQMEGKGGGNIPGLQATKYTFYDDTTVIFDHGSVQDGV